MFKKILVSSLSIIMFVSLSVGAFYVLSSTTIDESNKNRDRNEEKHNRIIFTPPSTPKSLTLFGERMPLEHSDVFESLDREVFTNCYYHSSTIRILKTAPRFFPIVEPILEEEGVPADFIYLAVAESGLLLTAKSPAGAVGFWQFMKKTAPEYGLEVNSEIDERYHLEKATRAACKYFKKSYENFGNWTAVAAAFNAGNSGMSKEMERQKETNYYNLLLNPETARYVYRIAALKLILEDPIKYGFDVNNKEKYEPWKTKEVEVNGSIESFPDWCKEHGTNYKVLKMLNPWLRDDKLQNKEGKSYFIKLPLKGERI